jgi:hypothetical protein
MKSATLKRQVRISVKNVVWTVDTAWEAAVRQAEQEEVIVMRDGHAVALLMPFDDDDLDWLARERDPEFLASLARARRQVHEGRTITHADLKRSL